MRDIMKKKEIELSNKELNKEIKDIKKRIIKKMLKLEKMFEKIS